MFRVSFGVCSHEFRVPRPEKALQNLQGLLTKQAPKPSCSETPASVLLLYSIS